MKCLTILFSIYMILLAILPCQDSDDFGDKVKYYTAVQTSHSGKEKAGQETCTPSCTCSCCSTVRTLTSQFTSGTIFIQSVLRTYAEAPVPAICEQSIAIWQPPQIS